MAGHKIEVETSFKIEVKVNFKIKVKAASKSKAKKATDLGRRGIARDAPSEGRGSIPRTTRAFPPFVTEVKGQDQEQKSKAEIKSQVKSGGQPNGFVLHAVASYDPGGAV